MAKPDIIHIGGQAYRWQEICDLRRRQLEARKSARGEQPTLFELKDDCRRWQSEPVPGGIRSRRSSPP